MRKALKDMASSKKFIAAVSGCISAGIMRLGFDVPVEDVAAIIGLLVPYILGQGLADGAKKPDPETFTTS